MGKAYDGPLSKDLPGGRVPVSEEAKTKSYYKYYLEEFYDISAEMKSKIRSSVFKKGQGLEVSDRRRLEEVAAFPAEPGYYALQGGGCLSCANVKTPDMTGEMLAWWADWMAIDHSRNVVWDPQDHYGIKVIENRERLFDERLPIGERIWTTKHWVLESFDKDEPSELYMIFYDPYNDFGFDASLRGTDRDLYTVAAQGYIGKIPAFAIERLCKGEDGTNEMRCRFWIGYEFQPETKEVKCKLPFFIKPPKSVVHNLVIHNYREWSRLNQILPRLYEEQKGKPLGED